MLSETELTGLVKTHKVLLDTSFAMDEGFPEFCRNVTGMLNGNRIFMPVVARKELLRLSRQSNPDTRAAALKALQAISAMEQDGKLELRHDASDTFTDLVIQRIVEQHLLKHDFCVLTNDVGLMMDLHSKRQKHSVNGLREVVVVKLHGRTHKPVLFVPRGTAAPAVATTGTKPFAVASTPAQDIDTPLTTRRDIGPSDVLYGSDGETVQLGKEIAAGGEGRVFDIAGRQEVCKVYHRDKLTVGLERKLTLMTGRQLHDPRVCWPLDVVRDADGVFRGFVMPRARGRSLRETLFVPRLWLKENPNWTRRQSVELAVNLLESIERLHQLNVVLGDINELNILLVDEKEVYFVDCDSCQVEGYPCPVGTVNFTAPEIQGRDFRTFLRTKDHDLYAVATLLFMILQPGKCPYSHQGGEDGAANILQGHFPYPLGEDSPTDGAPLGPWRFCWSHLSYDLKAAFYGSFDKAHLSPQRVPVNEWLRLLRKYSYYLSDPNKVFMGPSRQPGFDLSILPENYRRVPNQTETFENGYATDLEALSGRIRLRDNTNRQTVRGQHAARRRAFTLAGSTRSAAIGVQGRPGVTPRARPKRVPSAQASGATGRSAPIGVANPARLPRKAQPGHIASSQVSPPHPSGMQKAGRPAGGHPRKPGVATAKAIGGVVAAVLCSMGIVLCIANRMPWWCLVPMILCWMASCAAVLLARER